MYRILLPLLLGVIAGWLALLPGAATAQQSGLSLREVYQLARERNPMLQASEAAVQAVAAQERSARLPPDPQFQLGVMNASLPGLRTDMPGAMAPSVQVMQMVPFPGKLSLSGKIARQSTAMADAVAAETAWEVRAHAAMAVFEIYQIDRQIEVMRETLELLRNFEQVAKAMYVSGEGRQSDVLRASVEVVRMDAEIARMTAMRISATARLNAVLDRPAGTSVAALAFPPLPLTLPPADELRGWAGETRPLLVRSGIGVEQAGTRRSLARLELWPDLTVGVQYGQRPSDMGTERMGSLMLGVSLPVFAGRRQMQMRNEAAAMERMNQAELTDARARVNARIGELLAELDRARTLVDLYRTEVLPQAAANVSSSFSSYRVGTVDFMTLVDAQMTLNQFQQELYALLAEYGHMIAELEMTVGRELPLSNDILTEDR
jgi:outer membrane protein, heavy metal efflux system